jgi:hypothetical protein
MADIRGVRAMNQPFAARDPSPAPPPPVRPAPFEFSAPQEALFASLARVMRLVGGASAGFGGLLLLALFVNPANALVALVQGGLMLAIGLLTWSAAGAFQQVADTTGRDIQHLMDALGRLRTIYLVQAWTLAIALAFLVAVVAWVAIVIANR